MSPNISSLLYLDCGTNPMLREHEVLDDLLRCGGHGAGLEALPPVWASLLQGSAWEREPGPAVKQDQKGPIALPWSLVLLGDREGGNHHVASAFLPAFCFHSAPARETAHHHRVWEDASGAQRNLCHPGKVWLHLACVSEPDIGANQLPHSAICGLSGKSCEDASIFLYFPARNAFQRGGVWRDQRLHPGGVWGTL